MFNTAPPKELIDIDRFVEDGFPRRDATFAVEKSNELFDKLMEELRKLLNVHDDYSSSRGPLAAILLTTMLYLWARETMPDIKFVFHALRAVAQAEHKNSGPKEGV